MIAAAYSRADMVRNYLQIDPGSVHLRRTDKRSVIFWPCFLGDVEILDMFLERGVDVEGADADGWRPVHAAATAGHVACLARLIQHGAALEPNDPPSGTTLLHLAARNIHIEMLDFLLDQCRLPPSATDDKGWTPLHIAASLGLAPVIRRLVAAGSEIEARLPYGWTPLHVAIENRQAEAATGPCCATAGLRFTSLRAMASRAPWLDCSGTTPIRKPELRTAGPPKRFSRSANRTDNRIRSVRSLPPTGSRFMLRPTWIRETWPGSC
jgi:hypothetical protein